MFNWYNLFIQVTLLHYTEVVISTTKRLSESRKVLNLLIISVVVTISVIWYLLEHFCACLFRVILHGNTNAVGAALVLLATWYNYWPITAHIFPAQISECQGLLRRRPISGDKRPWDRG